MNSILLGIGVGGTHTDGVAVDLALGRIVCKVKTLTTTDLAQCSSKALTELLKRLGRDGIKPEDVSRVVLSTTLVTNTIAAGHIEPVGMILMAGPGINPASLAVDSLCRVVHGAMDHRGREIVPVNEDEIRRHLDSFLLQGVSVVAVAGKFSVRNPAHELQVARLAEPRFDHVSMAHRLSGALNFPRRAATAYLAAGVWRRHQSFVQVMTEAVRKMGIEAPLYLLRADGGAQLAESFSNAAETALSGPAASIMGVRALQDGVEETVALDIGGTTTDISLFACGVPLREPSGATIGAFKTQIHSLFTRSIAAGGDSLITVEKGKFFIGPSRRGAAAAFGGPAPTPTDALAVLGRAEGDPQKAREALAPLAAQLELTVEEFSELIVRQLCLTIAESVKKLLDEANSRPVYTIHELLEGFKIKPRRAVVVGGPAKGLKPYLEEALGLPLVVAPHHDVANAVGAAVASLTLEVNAVADTAEGYLSIPEAGIHRAIGKKFDLKALEREAKKALSVLAESTGSGADSYVVDVVESESFRIVEGFSVAGEVHRLRLRIRPSILCRVGPPSPPAVDQ
jgi:N-methylhydantoinase A/oxoprolinase/acetone carboxylase beta subunit